MFQKASQKLEKLSQITWIRRTFVVLFSSVAILSSASSCSLFNLPGESDKPEETKLYGVLKRDPSLEDGFGVLNGVYNESGEIGENDRGALNQALGVKMVQAASNNFYLLTSNRGVLRTEDGLAWEQKYLFESVDEDGNTIQSAIDKNNQFRGRDIEVDERNSEIVYVAGESPEGKGKIYKTMDGGLTWKEVYSDINKETSVLNIVISPNDSYELYAILNTNAVIKSTNGGDSWQKVQEFKDDVVDIGFYDSSTVFVLGEDDGLNFSSDKGVTWSNVELTKVESTLGESSGGYFGRGKGIDNATKMVVTNLPQKAAVLVADGQLWLSKDVQKGEFQKLPMPVSDDNDVDINTVTLHPSLGYKNIYASIDDKLFESIDEGQSWNIKDNIGGDTKLGDIVDITLDENSPSIFYLVLSN